MTLAFSLYAATVPSYLQILGGVTNVLDKAEAFCSTSAMAVEDIVQARLAPDMLPFCYQVKAVVVHSLGAIDAVRKGVFSPDRSEPPGDFALLRASVTSTLGMLSKIDVAEVDAFIGRDMRFEVGEHRMDFTAENFLLSFSLPNFYFHASTAYDIARFKGVSVGKRDYLGKLRTKA